MRIFVMLASFAALGLVATVPCSEAQAADCFNCDAKASTDACKEANQCRGSRDECRKAGCKITGTASCSTAANVKKCLAADEDYSERLHLTLVNPAEAACFVTGC